MSGRNVFEYLVIQGSGFSLTDGTKIPTHDPSKAGEFRKMKPRTMRIQLLQIKGVVKNAWHLLDLPVLKTQVRIVDFGNEILRMTAIGVPDQGGGVLLVTGSEIGNAEMVRKRGNMRVGRHQTFQLRDCLCGIMLGKLVEVVNTRLHLRREPLDVAIVERFVRDGVLGVHQGIRGQPPRNTRCGRRLVLWTLCWAFLACHGAISLWTHDVLRDIPCLYDTIWRPPCHRDGRGFAFPSCQGVSSRHDDMPMLLLRPCQVYSPCP